MPFSVRPAAVADAPAIVEFNCRLAFETEDRVLDPSVISPGVAALLDDINKGRYFVADASGEVIGQVMITYEWSDWRNSWIWWLQSVYVRADWRRRGVFRRLLDFVVAQAAQEQVATVRLYVEVENTVAQTTYRELGFEPMHFHLMQRSL